VLEEVNIGKVLVEMEKLENGIPNDREDLNHNSFSCNVFLNERCNGSIKSLTPTLVL